jgi:hypothetical protein
VFDISIKGINAFFNQIHKFVKLELASKPTLQKKKLNNFVVKLLFEQSGKTNLKIAKFSSPKQAHTMVYACVHQFCMHGLA